jgi:hypothetical protein
MLRNEGVFAPLRLGTLWSSTEDVQHTLDEPGVVALAADVAAHESLTDVGFFFTPMNTPATLDAVVNAALTRQLPRLMLAKCGLSPASAPALARLLGSASLVELMFSGGPDQPRLLDAAASATLGAALRTNRTLYALGFAKMDFWHDLGAARELLRALATHRKLGGLALFGNLVQQAHRAAAGAVLGEFVATAKLHTLDVSRCNLGDEGLGPLVDALPANTRLYTLICYENGVSEAFVRDRLLPAVRANTRLGILNLQLEWDSAREAEALVHARNG